MNRITPKFIFLTALMLAISACQPTPPAEPEAEPMTAEEPPPPPEHRPEYGPQELDDGGITSIPTGDPELIAHGEYLFESRTCSECHSMDRPRRGPPLGGVTEKRTPQWLARMIMHPERMVRLDPVARAQLSEYMCMMPDLGVTPDETRALLAYLATQPEPDADQTNPGEHE